MNSVVRPLRLLLGWASADRGSASPLRLRTRRGAAPGRRRRIADALSALVPIFVFLVVLGIAVSWSFLAVGVLRGSRRKPAPRDARRKGGSFRILGMTLPNFGRWSSGDFSSAALGSEAGGVPPSDAAANGQRRQEEWHLDAILDGEERRRPERFRDRRKAERNLAHRVDKLKLPSPIVVVGMPKAGTTSINSYFRCGGRKSSHFACEADSAEFDDLPPVEAKLAAASQSAPGEPWRNCRLPKGAGGPASSAGEYPLCGVCVRRNILTGRPPLEGCGEYEVWSELDSAEHPLPTPLANIERRRREREDKAQEEAAKKVQEQMAQLEKEGGEEVSVEEALELANAARQEAEEGKASSDEEGETEGAGDSKEDDYGGVRPLCSYPQITHLDEIHAAYPNATFILNLRPVEKWIQSISKWTGDRRRSGVGYLRQVLTRCDFPGLPAGKGGDDVDLKAFYDGHSQRVRDFVRRHPSHALVEVNIEEADAGKVMEAAFGISSECWTVRNASPGTGGPGERRRERRERFQRIREMMGGEDLDRRPRFADDDVVETLRERRRERADERRQRRGHGEGNVRRVREEEERERRRNDRLDLDKADDIRGEMMEERRRRRERHREDLLEDRMEMRRAARRPGRDDSRYDGRRGRRRWEDAMDRMLMRRGGGRSRRRYARYPMCTDTADLFQSSV